MYGSLCRPPYGKDTKAPFGKLAFVDEMRQSTETMPRRIRMCAEHNKECDVFCEPCVKSICLQCAVFKHDGHHKCSPADAMTACKKRLEASCARAEAVACSLAAVKERMQAALAQLGACPSRYQGEG